MAQVHDTTLSLFERTLVCRSVTNFPGDTVEEAAAKASAGGVCSIHEFKAAVVAGLIVPRHRRHGRIRTGFRTLTPPEREAWEARHCEEGRKVHLCRGKRNLSTAERRLLERRHESVHKHERWRALPLDEFLSLITLLSMLVMDRAQKPAPSSQGELKWVDALDFDEQVEWCWDERSGVDTSDQDLRYPAMV
jgi:hypothetical protein